jgi:hypothetical protein
MLCFHVLVHRHTLLAHLPCPPVAHSMALAALFRSVWISEISGSSGRIAARFAKLAEKRVPAKFAARLAACESESHRKALRKRGRRIANVHHEIVFGSIARLLK